MTYQPSTEPSARLRQVRWISRHYAFDGSYLEKLVGDLARAEALLEEKQLVR